MIYVKTDSSKPIDYFIRLFNKKVPTELLDRGYEGVAFRVFPIKENWLTVLQLHEYRKSMDVGRAFHNGGATVQTISGAIGLFHTKELVRQIDIHSGEFSGEDLQRTLLILVEKDTNGVVITDSIVETFAPRTLSELFNQRLFGWNPGYYSNLTLYVRLLFAPHVQFKLRLEAIYNVVLVTLLDGFRLVSLPVLLFSPTFIAIFLVAYIILESITWICMGRKEPYWVVLLMPAYGLFNFVARVGSGSVFLYRRLAYYVMKHKASYDDYRHARLAPRVSAIAMSLVLFVVPLSGYTASEIIPGSQSEQIIEMIYPQTELVTPIVADIDVQIGDAEYVVEDAHIPVVESVVYSYTVDANETYLSVFKQSIEKFSIEENISLSELQKDYIFLHLLIQYSDATKKQISDISIRKSDIQAAYESVQYIQ